MLSGARLVVPPPGAMPPSLDLPDYPKRVFEAAELSPTAPCAIWRSRGSARLSLPGFIASTAETSLHPIC